jgi:hypothetical protein
MLALRDLRALSAAAAAERIVRLRELRGSKVDERNTQRPEEPQPNWLRLRMRLFMLVVALATTLLVWFARLDIFEAPNERLPNETEVLSDEAVRVAELDGRQTKATLLLPDGGLLEFQYRRFSDSGVKARRLDRPGGNVVWQQECDSVGVCHSEYYHEVAVHIEGRTVRIVSRGSYGAFVERLDIESGTSLVRVRKSVQDGSFLDRVLIWLRSI